MAEDRSPETEETLFDPLAITLSFATTLDFDSLLILIPDTIRRAVNCGRCVVLLKRPEDILQLRGAAAVEEAWIAYPKFIVSFYHHDEPEINAWRRGETTVTETANAIPDSVVAQIGSGLHMVHFHGIPFVRTSPLSDDNWIGILLLDSGSDAALTVEQIERAQMLVPGAASALANALQYSAAIRDLAAKNDQIRILGQIDRELNDRMVLDRVFDFTLDWAMRFTNAGSATLALYDETRDLLYESRDLGYDTSSETLAEMRATYGGGIARRVARSAHSELIPDVSVDADYIALSPAVRTHLSVPVMREERVIAVISLESKQVNSLTEEHLTFIEKLAARAGVAIDNARLFDDSVHERDKLSAILGSTADIVIVVDPNEHILLVNPSAIAAFGLYPDRDYHGQPFNSVFEGMELLRLYERAKTPGDAFVDDIQLSDAHTYHANFAPFPGIGWIIVLHDITAFKRTDQLKNLLLSTVSHDLKNPLMVMRGYLELIQIQFSDKVPPLAEQYLNMALGSIENMDSLISDLLSLAHLESGMTLDPHPVTLQPLLEACVNGLQPLAGKKVITMTFQAPPNLTPAWGDAARLTQIFNNLISNAIKYTPPEGTVSLNVREDEGLLIVSIQDSGIGISPEDQTRIFESFYRVRRPETASIEGTGLGLAIVKRLVEAHRGQIGLESRLGEGTTFYVTLPAAPSLQNATPLTQ